MESGERESLATQTSTVSPVGTISVILRPRQEDSRHTDMTIVATEAAAIALDDKFFINQMVSKLLEGPFQSRSKN